MDMVDPHGFFDRLGFYYWPGSVQTSDTLDHHGLEFYSPQRPMDGRTLDRKPFAFKIINFHRDWMFIVFGWNDFSGNKNEIDNNMLGRNFCGYSLDTLLGARPSHPHG